MSNNPVKPAAQPRKQHGQWPMNDLDLQRERKIVQPIVAKGKSK